MCAGMQSLPPKHLHFHDLERTLSVTRAALAIRPNHAATPGGADAVGGGRSSTTSATCALMPAMG